MTEDKEREMLLARIARHTDMDYAAASTVRLRQVADLVEEGARAIAGRRRISAMADGWAKPVADGETSKG